MVSKKWTVMLVALSAGLMNLVAMAQVAKNLPPLEPYALFPTQDPQALRRLAILGKGLTNGKLQLTTEQKARIDKVLDAYVAEQIELNRKSPLEKGAPPKMEAVQPRQAAVAKLDAGISDVMNDAQRRTWTEAQTARRGAVEAAMSTAPRSRDGK